MHEAIGPDGIKIVREIHRQRVTRQAQEMAAKPPALRETVALENWPAAEAIAAEQAAAEQVQNKKEQDQLRPSIDRMEAVGAADRGREGKGAAYCAAREAQRGARQIELEVGVCTVTALTASTQSLV